MSVDQMSKEDKMDDFIQSQYTSNTSQDINKV